MHNNWLFVRVHYIVINYYILILAVNSIIFNSVKYYFRFDLSLSNYWMMWRTDRRTYKHCSFYFKDWRKRKKIFNWQFYVFLFDVLNPRLRAEKLNILFVCLNICNRQKEIKSTQQFTRNILSRGENTFSPIHFLQPIWSYIFTTLSGTFTWTSKIYFHFLDSPNYKQINS